LPVERRVLARRGWTGEIRNLFEHPARESVADTVRTIPALSPAPTEFFSSLLASPQPLLFVGRMSACPCHLLLQRIPSAIDNDHG
jgi:hypothetical protein